MDIGIPQVRKSGKKNIGRGTKSNIEGAVLSIRGGGARAAPKVYKLTPVIIIQPKKDIKMHSLPSIGRRANYNLYLKLVLNYKSPSSVRTRLLEKEYNKASDEETKFMNMTLSHNVGSDSGIGVGNILTTPTPTPTPAKTINSDRLRLRFRFRFRSPAWLIWLHFQRQAKHKAPFLSLHHLRWVTIPTPNTSDANK